MKSFGLILRNYVFYTIHTAIFSPPPSPSDNSRTGIFGKIENTIYLGPQRLQLSTIHQIIICFKVKINLQIWQKIPNFIEIGPCVQVVKHCRGSDGLISKKKKKKYIYISTRILFLFHDKMSNFYLHTYINPTLIIKEI